MSAKDEATADNEGSSTITSKFDKKLDTEFDKPLIDKIRRDPAELLVYSIGLAFFFYHLYYAQSFFVSSDQHVIIHVGFALVFWASLKLVKINRSTTRGKLFAGAFLLYMVAAVIPTYYFFTNYQSLLFGAGSYSPLDLAMGVAVLVLLMVALWNVSWLIFSVVVLGFLYSYFGPYLPGVLFHSGLSLERIISMNTVELNGIFGRLTLVAATWVTIFVILAGLIEKYGGMDKLIKGITRATERSEYLKVSHVAVFGSMIFGSINGATTANAATTGAFTIPLMKENGYPPRLAAAIESVASCGGQVLPPVMGTSVFIMAELIDPSYGEIVIAAVAPALLFFTAIILSIELYTHKVGADPRRSTTSTGDRSIVTGATNVLKNYEYIGMVIVLLYWLVYIQADPLLAGYYTIVTLIGLRIVHMIQLAILGDGNFHQQARDFGRQSLEGFRRGAEAAVEISIMVASLGIVVRAFIVTGFAQNLSQSLIAIAGDSVILMIVVAALASIVFGMGMPTVAAYLLVALFVAPPLAEVLPVDILAVHMFVFYFAIVSNITPPIAVAVVVTQGIAESDFLETAIDALRLGFPLFILPFLFVFNDVLLSPSVSLVPTVLFLSIGFLALSVAFIGYNDASLPIRGVFLAIGILTLFTQQLVYQGGLALLVVVAFVVLTPRLQEFYTSARGDV